jgi:hypothetical protein
MSLLEESCEQIFFDNKIMYAGVDIIAWYVCIIESLGKGKVKFSPLQALEALRVVRG